MLRLPVNRRLRAPVLCLPSLALAVANRISGKRLGGMNSHRSFDDRWWTVAQRRFAAHAHANPCGH